MLVPASVDGTVTRASLRDANATVPSGLVNGQVWGLRRRVWDRNMISGCHARRLIRLRWEVLVCVCCVTLLVSDASSRRR